ncbi:mycothiol transferase [Ornithinimicrobium panacihumi]|uniref:mycothiol transferase n=1 Tax=Ornithinimicrobium panacihumi TaxID=2008449 RepID=UPI003F8C4547
MQPLTMATELDRVLAHLRAERAHVTVAGEGLTESDLTRSVVPSGWSMAAMVNHLTFDDEIFWGCAVIGGDEEAIALVQDGWSVPVESGEHSLARYARWCARTDSHLAAVDLDAPPRWWPGPEVFPFPAFPQAALAAWRLVVETTAHAGHLDVARELLDGKQHLVVG